MIRNLKYIIPAMLVVCVLSGASQQPTANTHDQELSAHRAKAAEYLAQKDADHAIKELTAILQLDPNDAEAHANLGFLFFIKNDCERAVPELRSAVDARTDFWRQRVLLGLCEERLGDAKGAIHDLQFAYPSILDDNLKFMAGKSLILLYSNTGELAKAAAILEDLRPSHPTDLELLYISYRIYTDLAGEAMISLSLVDADSAQMHQVMGYEMMRYGDQPSAIAHYRQAIKANPNLPGLHFELAEALNTDKAGGNKAEAEAEYKLALQQNPTDEKAECRLGEFASDRGDLDEALKHYQRAYELQPQEPAAMLGLAKIYAARKQLDKAASLLEQLEKNDPTDDSVHFRLGTVYRQMGRTEDAKREFAEYQKYKEMKDKLRKIYKDLRLPEGRGEEEKGVESKP